MTTGLLDGKVAVVTGAAQGLGRAIAEVMVGHGAKVALLDLDGDRAAETSAAIGSDSIAVACDVSDESSVSAAAAAVESSLGPADVLVNNAALVSFSPLEDLPLAQWQRLVDVNLTGSFLCAQHFGRQMIAKRSGSIVNIGSVAGGHPQALSEAYSPTKAGAIMLARQIGIEWGYLGIRGNCVSPGMMQTPMAEGFLSDPESYEGRRNMVASKRIGDPREVAEVVAFVASDAASYVNAQNIEVDGGMMQMLLKVLPRPGVRLER